MIKLERNTFTADLLPIENPRTKVLSEHDEWMMRVNEVLLGKEKPKNAPNVVSQSIVAVNRRILVGSASGIYGFPAGGVYNNAYLQTPLAYKLQNINDINLRINVSLQNTVPQGFGPTPSGPYSVMYYVVISADSQDSAVLRPECFLVVPFTLNYNNTTQLFSFTSKNINLRLKDTTKERERIGENPIFTINPTKVTPVQYARLASEDMVLDVVAGFDVGQFDTISDTTNPVLSVANKDHFKFFLYGNGSFSDNSSYFLLNTSLVFTYSGVLADYVPLD